MKNRFKILLKKAIKIIAIIIAIIIFYFMIACIIAFINKEVNNYTIIAPLLIEYGGYIIFLIIRCYIRTKNGKDQK